MNIWWLFFGFATFMTLFEAWRYANTGSMLSLGLMIFQFIASVVFSLMAQREKSDK